MSELISLLQDETLNLMLARMVLEEMLKSPELSPRLVSHTQFTYIVYKLIRIHLPFQISEQHGWHQISDPSTIRALCSDVIAANPKMVAQYMQGKTKILYGLAGEIVKRTEQRANMARVVDTLTELLTKKP